MNTKIDQNDINDEYIKQGYIDGFDTALLLKKEALEIAKEALLTVECCGKCRGCREKVIDALINMSKLIEEEK